jgi:sulfite oxidase
MNRLKPVFYSSSAVFTYYYLDDKTYVKYSYEEIEKHTNEKMGIWTTYKNNIYDITDFVDIHPGGKDKILLAAGNSVEPYWEKYTQHLKPEVLDTILIPMKIGEIEDYNANYNANYSNMYVDEPIRNNSLNYHTIKPCNAEVSPDDLISTWITPNELWYIRNNNPVPNIDINNYKLNIDISENNNSFFNFIWNNKYDLDMNTLLNKYSSHDIITTIQCGGNRRGDLNMVLKTSGTPWNIGAISTAKWTGIMVRDILPKNIDKSIKYLNIKGIDDVEISIPIEKILNPYGDVMLAYKMNDDELPRDHGYPLRLIVPGYVGIRNIKWVKSIKLSSKEVNSSWQSGLSYKALPNFIKDKNEIDKNQIDINSYYPINENPIQSAICSVKEIKDNKLIIKGFAYSGGGRGILRVDVSIDKGKSWSIAKLKEGSEQNPIKSWAWTFWELEIEKPDSSNYLINGIYGIFNKIQLFEEKTIINIMCKATDIGYNIQPKTIDDTWNIRGLNNNSWHNYIYNLINK